MQTTPAVESYLKAVWQLRTTGCPPTPGAVAERLQVSAPSVSAMIKRLIEGGYVSHSAGRDIALTDRGTAEAVHVVRRHRLLETFLAEVVGLSWDEVHDEAEILEHVLSARLEARMDALLGYPERDPHGDPIPPADGTHDEGWGEPLAAAAEGSRFRVDRVSDRDSTVLRYLSELGIRPGVVVEVGERMPFDGPQWISVDGVRHAVGDQLARLVHGTVSPATHGTADPAAGVLS